MILLCYHRSATWATFFEEMMILSDGFKFCSTLPAPLVVVEQSRASECVNVLQAFGKTSARKFIGNAKCTDSFRHFFDGWRCFELLPDFSSLDIKVISGNRTVIRF